MALVHLNGELIPAEQATVSVLDRGFLLGDGVYEVIPAYGGRLFRLHEHLERLQHSLDAIRLANPHSMDAWQHLLEELVAANEGRDQSVYLQVTRGAAKRDHAFPEQVTPTIFAMANPIAEPDPALAETGVAAITLEDIRWHHCHIKSICLLPNVLLRQQAVDQGVAEAILVREGIITEGAASNVFIVEGGRLVTPPKGPYLLPGITRDLVLELAREHGVPCEEREFDRGALLQADEVWLTSSTKEILPVTHLDEHVIGDGRPGPLWRQLSHLYRDYKERLRQGTAP